MKLKQKSFFNGTYEYVVAGDVLNVRIKKFFREEKLSIGLAILNPEPVISETHLEFRDRYNDRQLLTLALDKPNATEFNAFIAHLKQKLQGEGQAVAHDGAKSEVHDWNVYEEPPEFAQHDDAQKQVAFQPVNAERIGTTITMLKTYMNEEDIKPLLDALETLQAEPDNEVAFNKMLDAFNALGINQGAVLNYAQYLKVLLSKYI